MLKDFDQLNVEEALKGMQEKEQQLKSLRGVMDKRIQEQSVLFHQNAKKVLPLLEFLQQSNYRFSNPSSNIKYSSTRGPILAHDSHKRKLYIYSINDARISVVNLDDDTTTFVNPQTFFEEFSFEDAIEGLRSSLLSQVTYHEYLNKQVAEREALLTKYSQNP
jgi:hypothetical protein